MENLAYIPNSRPVFQGYSVCSQSRTWSQGIAWCLISIVVLAVIGFILTDLEKSEKNKPKSKEVFGYPISIFFIVVNEFCERFSYYGMRAVLVLYFKYFLQWDDDTATSIYHTFVALCYLTPILGAIVADSWLGKYKTIVYLSIVYTLGQGVLAVSAIHDITDSDRNGTPDNLTLHVALSMIGLILIALGTGGIKPCVAAFGGDQFGDHQEKQRSTFFSIFYLSINAGSLLSTVITPILRAQECGIHVHQKCYPLAFGVPAGLMVVALVVFIVGNRMYIKAAPKGNIMLDVCKCIGFAVKNRFRHRSDEYEKREHWMDWAEEKYNKLLIAQVKMVLKVLFLYIPLPMFWALFDQQGSRWTLQATTMDGNFGFLIIQPDQMQTVNPILILVLVPIMDSAVYPLIKKCGLNFTPLRRMTVGMLLAGLAFVAAALVQIEIDKTLPNFPASNEAQLKFLNLGNSPLDISAENNPPFAVPPFEATADYVTFVGDEISVSAGLGFVSTIPLQKGKRQTLLIDPAKFTMEAVDDLTNKPEQGENAIRFVNGLENAVNVTTPEDNFWIASSSVSNNTMLHEGKSTFKIFSAMGECTFSMTFGFGSSYTLVIPSNIQWIENCGGAIKEVLDIKPNTMHMAWQIPQYFLITCGEVVFSVTGLEFSYSQAPSNMKAVLQAGWLFTVAVGNIIVLIVAEAVKLPDQWAEYILFASLLVAVCVAFAVMAYFYTYIDPTEIEAQFQSDNIEKEKENEKDNEKEKVEMDSISLEKKELEEGVKQTKI
ncbi:solute carrier family 15 member 1-like [Conger conger]|uniref:solute carrier family 15 member 1-like n=1 Tax=Conger conger TaxID=82655 RepID=UPI002A5AA6DF|nr:solute carrier family 15 member 1-like [Conger conger]